MIKQPGSGVETKDAAGNAACVEHKDENGYLRKFVHLLFYFNSVLSLYMMFLFSAVAYGRKDIRSEAVYAYLSLVGLYVALRRRAYWGHRREARRGEYWIFGWAAFFFLLYGLDVLLAPTGADGLLISDWLSTAFGGVVAVFFGGEATKWVEDFLQWRNSRNAVEPNPQNRN